MHTSKAIGAVGSFVLILGLGVVSAAPLNQITICHKGKTITVSQNSIRAHAAHGDKPGACGNLCACDFTFDPVTCSSDGRTYVNPCIAACNGATGCARPGGCACSLIYDPVFCSDGNTYANQCVADCSGATGCTGPSCLCACPIFFDPVFCSSNGVSYVNPCVAECCTGATGCTRYSTCGCLLGHDPVACSDGHTYPNQCMATCAGATGCSPPCSDCPGGFPESGTSVICTTGNTYPNQCQGICAGEECYYSDNAVICDPDAGCSGGGLFAPVICPNGASYVNAALASCCLHGATDGCRDGACLFTCPSTANPVTCANGKTYKNPCFATCDGASGCASAP